MYIKYILTHPIQYQSPFIRYLTKKGIKITTLYRCDFSIKKFYDTQFKKVIKWDIDLLKGYKYRFLIFIGANISAVRISSSFMIVFSFSLVICIFSPHKLRAWYNK